MTPSTTTSLFDLCTELLDACSAAVTLAPGGAIATAFVAPGNPAFDCAPMLTVHAGGPQQVDTIPLSPSLQPGLRVLETGHVNLIVVTVTVIRCSPTLSQNGRIPSPAKLQDSAAEIQGDVWTIWNHLATLKRNGGLYPPDQRAMFFDPAVPVPLQGATAGWQMPFRIQLDGFRTV